MEENKHHISSYTQLAIVLIILLLLTTISVLITELSFGALSVGVALLVASIKGTAVLTYFMHLKSEKLYLKLFVAGIFLVYILVIIITFIDYLLR